MNVTLTHARQTKIVPTMMDRTLANANQVIASMPHPTLVLMTMNVLRTLVDPHKPVAAPTFQDPSAVTATKDTSTTQTTRNALTLMNASILSVESVLAPTVRERTPASVHRDTNSPRVLARMLMNVNETLVDKDVAQIQLAVMIATATLASPSTD